MWPFSKAKPKVEPEPVKKQLYAIDVITTHKSRFVVECEEKKLDDVLIEIPALSTLEYEEFSQEHLGDTVVSFFPIEGNDHYLKLFDNENDYLKKWPVEQKLNLINRK